MADSPQAPSKWIFVQNVHAFLMWRLYVFNCVPALSSFCVNCTKQPDWLNKKLNTDLIQMMIECKFKKNYLTVSTCHFKHLTESKYRVCSQIQPYKYTSGQHQRCKNSKEKSKLCISCIFLKAYNCGVLKWKKEPIIIKRKCVTLMSNSKSTKLVFFFFF